jgi:hypothetical protein
LKIAFNSTLQFPDIAQLISHLLFITKHHYVTLQKVYTFSDAQDISITEL